MCETISVINQKGGVAKTTTSHALIMGLKQRGFRVLGIDLDGSRNLSKLAGADGTKPTAMGLMLGEVSAKDSIQKTNAFDIIQGHKGMGQLDSQLKEVGREYELKERIEEIKPDYDFIIIDTPPSLSLATIVSLVASDRVVIPTRADFLDLDGIADLMETITAIKKRNFNPGLKVDGVLLTFFSDRTNAGRTFKGIAENMAEIMGAKVYSSTIREATALKEAQAMKQSIFDYAPNSNIANDYNGFIEELLKGGEKDGQ